MAIIGDDITFIQNGTVTTTDSWASVPFLVGPSVDQTGSLWFLADTSGPLSFNLKNTGANTLDYRILGANDLSLVSEATTPEWSIEVASATLASGVSVGVSVNPCLYHYYKLQIKSDSAGNQSTLQVKACHKRL